jgi:uracil-DNA glycosylase family 4
MGWTERQRAMLAEMGLTVWAPGGDAAQAAAGDEGRAAEGEGGLDAVAASSAAAPSPARAVAPPRPLAALSSPSAGPAALTGTRPAGIDAMDWSALREAVAGCTACKLCTGRTQTVFGVGHTQARWLVVGEAPGEQEDRQGEPFVGKSGQLLDNMLRAIRLTRGESADPAQQVYIANTVKCRPPGNRNPAPEELAQCEPFLIRQIELLQPKIILAMGRFAVQSLLRSTEPIGRLRGRVHRYQGVPLIVTYHPAYLLRNLEDKAKAWDDLCLALDVVAGTA